MKILLSLVMIVCLASSAPAATGAGVAVPDDREAAAGEGAGSETDEGLPREAVPETGAGADERPAVLARQAVKEAEILYERAVNSYETGNSSRAAELYSEALAKLSSAKLNAGTQYELKDDFKEIFKKLDNLLESAQYPKKDPEKKYTIPMDAENELVKKYLKLYTEGNGKVVIKKALEKSGRYRAMIVQVLREYDLPEELVYLPVVESLYNNNDLSHAGALGLWQLMPERARALGLKVNYWIDERKDPEKSTRAAARYLKELYIMFDDWHLALAAYNRGEYGLARDLRFSKATDIRQISSRKAVPRETERFVPQFIACTLIGDNYRKYGFDLSFDRPLSFDRVRLNNIVDLKVVAECANSTITVIRELNPALKAWCTPHNYADFELLLPAGTKEAFAANIARVKDLNPSQGYIKYKVGKGDCLSRIAKKFATTVAAIKEDNRIRNPKELRINQVLVIRPGRRYLSEAKE